MVACVITSQEIVSVPLASVDAGMDGTATPARWQLSYYSQKLCEVLCANFHTVATLKTIQTMAVYVIY